jgi:protein-S-isoprenylcysteine O-methyltransferase Ste14
MPPYVLAILAAGWVGWLAPFFLRKRGRGPAATVDRRARWGLLCQGVAYSLVWHGPFWTRSPGVWRVVAGTALFALAGILSWTSVWALGRQWRIEAGLNEDHELVRSGAYRFVRHPIYTSMICQFFGTGALIARPWLLAPAALLMVLGTEIRVRVEDRLLASRFGPHFEAYRRSVGAYVPFLR